MCLRGRGGRAGKLSTVMEGRKAGDEAGGLGRGWIMQAWKIPGGACLTFRRLQAKERVLFALEISLLLRAENKGCMDMTRSWEGN